MLLSGASQVVFMAGDPVAQVQLPALFNERARRAGLDVALVPLHTEAGALEALTSVVLGTRNCLGLVLTTPHKQAAARLATALSPRAQRLGVANVLRRTRGGLEGDMFDGEGFWNGAIRHGCDPAGRSLALLGAGAAARAIALEFLRRGGRAMVFRTAEPSEQEAMHTLCPHAALWQPGGPQDVDIVVNATPVGMLHAPGMALAPSELAQLQRETWVADLVTQPMQTPLLDAAAKRGLRTIHGAATACGQLEAVAGFLGVPLPEEKT